MARTQMRLDAVTGSIVDINTNKGAKAPVADKVHADLQDILEEFAGVAARIHGEADFTNQDAGRFSHPVSSSVSAKPAMVLDGAAEQMIEKKGTGGLKVSVAGANLFKVATNGTDRFTVADAVVSSSVRTVVSGARVENLIGGAGAIVFQNGAKDLVNSGFLKWDGTPGSEKLAIQGAVSGSGAFTGASAAFDGALSAGSAAVAGNATVGGTLGVSGEATLASATVSDLTDGRVVYAGAAGALVDSSEMTFGAGGLTLAKDLSARSGSFSGDVTIAGDLMVQGDTVTVNVGELTIEDKDIVIAKVASPTDVTADQAGIIVKGATDKTIRWSNTSKYWEFSEGVRAPSGTFYNLNSQLVKADANGKLIDAHSMDFITGTLNQVNLTAGSLAGSVVLSLPQSIHTDADVEFDSLKLGDNVADAGKALKIGAAGEVIAAAWDEFVSVEADVGLELVQDGFKAQIGLAQDIRTSASPEFAGLELTSFASKLLWSNAGVVEAKDLSYFVQETANQVLVADDGDGTITLSLPYDISDASNTALVGFSATSILGALNELAAGSGGGKGKWAEMLGADAGDGVHTFASGPDWSAAGFDMARVDIYLNGQLMKMTEDYALSSTRTVTFTFALKMDDVVTARIC